MFFIRLLGLNHLYTLLVFCLRKALLYSFFAILAIFILGAYYLKSIPTMDQSVELKFHLVNHKYYAFAFSPHYKNELCSSQQDIKLEFEGNTLTFKHNFFCTVVINERMNEINFEEEFYQIWLSIEAQYMLTTQINTVLQLTSYLVGNTNLRQQNYVKLGETYEWGILKWFPFRIIIKIFNRISEILDINDQYSKSADFLLFTHIPNNQQNLQAIILELPLNEATYDIKMQFTPILQGLRYYLYFHFYTTFYLGLLSLLGLFIFLWEILLNVSLWLAIITAIKDLFADD